MHENETAATATTNKPTHRRKRRAGTQRESHGDDGLVTQQAPTSPGARA
jgi:hypothetical protein